jgi:hypothetical protein
LREEELTSEDLETIKQKILESGDDGNEE